MITFFDSLSTSISALIHSEASDCKTKTLQTPQTDGAECDKAHHEVLFESATLKVIDVIVKPKTQEPFHTHERCAIMYVDLPASIQIFLDPQNPLEIPISVNNPNQRIDIIPNEGLHFVKNIDDKQFRAFRVEIKLDICALVNYADLSNKICEMIKTHKAQWDLIRQKQLQYEVENTPLNHALSATPALTLQYNAVSTPPTAITISSQQPPSDSSKKIFTL